MEESVFLGTKPLVDSIRHFIRDPSGVFSVCHLCECRIVQWRHDSRLLLLLKWFLHVIKRTLYVGSKIWILCSRGKNNISLEHKIHIFSPPCNILYVWILFFRARLNILAFPLILSWKLYCEYSEIKAYHISVFECKFGASLLVFMPDHPHAEMILASNVRLLLFLLFALLCRLEKGRILYGLVKACNRIAFTYFQNLSCGVILKGIPKLSQFQPRYS